MLHAANALSRQTHQLSLGLVAEKQQATAICQQISYTRIIDEPAPIQLSPPARNPLPAHLERREIILEPGLKEGLRKMSDVRTVTKNKGVFTRDLSLLKLIYLATERIARKWTMPLYGWAVYASQLKIIFGNRMKADL